MIDCITAGPDVLAYVVRASLKPAETFFVTPPALDLQMGFVVYPANGAIAAHRHTRIPRTIAKTCEVILVRSGRCDVDIYADNRELVATRTLDAGDVVILIGGGHGFRMQEDTVLLEVKQGPYHGALEKEML